MGPRGGLRGEPAWIAGGGRAPRPSAPTPRGSEGARWREGVRLENLSPASVTSPRAGVTPPREGRARRGGAPRAAPLLGRRSLRWGFPVSWPPTGVQSAPVRCTERPQGAPRGRRGPVRALGGEEAQLCSDQPHRPAAGGSCALLFSPPPGAQGWVSGRRKAWGTHRAEGTGCVRTGRPGAGTDAISRGRYLPLRKVLRFPGWGRF